MAITLQLSPTSLQDEVVHCDDCDEETNHISMFARVIASGETGYYLACEPCSLTWEWS